MYLDVVAMERRVLGDEHPLTCRSLSSLARLYMQQRRYKEAEPPSLAAYAGLSKRLGLHNDQTREAADQLARLYAAMGQTKTAREWRLKAGK